MARGETALAGRHLYLVLTSAQGDGRGPWELAREAAEAGVGVLQLREKTLPRGVLVDLGRRLTALCRSRGVIFIVNDDPELALEVDADGVHLGQEDLAAWPVERVRTLLGDRLIGVSTHDLAQFRAAQDLDVDYAAFGPVFPTQAKPYHVGTADIPAALALARKPTYVIGGITLAHLPGLQALGVTRVALIRDILAAPSLADRVLAYRGRLG